ncbi:MAG: GTPase Era [Desulfosalsimonadaceae bacterium]
MRAEQKAKVFFQIDMMDAGDTEKKFHSGFIAIAGPPNVGKSTLLNAMIGRKISITSEKPQTTRNRIAGIAHRRGAQLIFLDTPGIHLTNKTFNRKMVDVAFSAIDDVDLIVLVIDAAKPAPRSEAMLLERLEKSRSRPVILAINKIDLVGKTALLPIIDKWAGSYVFENIYPVSAKNGTQVPELIGALEAVLPEGPPYYPQDMVTDVSEEFILTEIIREKVFSLTEEEVPFSTAVSIELMEDDEERDLIRLYAKIHVERDSQKKIIIGKKGAKLKEIGRAARLEMERLLGIRVYLKIFIRVEKNWSKDARSMRRLGY